MRDRQGVHNEQGVPLAAVEAGLNRAARLAASEDVAVPSLRGKLLRPFAALSLVSPEHRGGPLPERFWLGCLAVQMAHEASLHHDDVLDGGFGRRSAATLLAREGPGAALLTGDLYLTGAYQVALMTEWDEFPREFATAVATTVRGEAMQAELAALSNPGARCEEVARAKSGALFGAAAVLAACAGERSGTLWTLHEFRDLGVEFGAFYQRVDDFLDYCPADDTGKPKLQDFGNRVWTSVLDGCRWEWFDRTPEEAIAAFFRAGGAGEESMAWRAAARVKADGSALVARLRALDAAPELVGLVEGWMRRCLKAAREGCARTSERPAPRVARPVPAAAQAPPQATTAARLATRALAIGSRAEWGRYFSRNSRTFSFAALLFPPRERKRVRDIYAFCRFTDDLVDRSDDTAAELAEILDLWSEVCALAYRGCRTGIPLADVVMTEMARQRIPFDLAAALIEGVRMDAEPRTYRSMEELGRYTHHVASVVGAWLTQAFGVRSPWVLERAHALGHAMQLTNIVRDVGEDLSLGRIYLPADRMAAHGVTRESLAAMKRRTERGGSVDAGYIELLEEIMAAADSSYSAAYEAMPSLPARFRRPVAVAAQVYRGIHSKIRANGYDNFNRRAYTTFGEKLVLARRGLGRLRPGAAASR